ncbi:hypothetical protein RKJ43_01220 [Klebsiella pneumoniae]|nr:hypothetical protein [Klebsiella pneumoniae]
MGFNVLSMSLSLVAVFLPLLLMGGLPGRLLRESSVHRRWRSASRWRSPHPDADDVRLAAESGKPHHDRATRNAALAAAGGRAGRLW